MTTKRASVAVPDAHSPHPNAESLIYRNPAAASGLKRPHPKYYRGPENEGWTLYENFQSGLSVEAGQRPCLGSRARVRSRQSSTSDPQWLNYYDWMTYQEVWREAQRVGSGLMAMAREVPEVARSRLTHNLPAERVDRQATVARPSVEQQRSLLPAQDASSSVAAAPPVAVPAQWHVGLYSINRPEWVIAEQACNAYSLVTVALYDTLGADTLEFCINYAELGVVVCSRDKLAGLLRLAPKCPGLKVLVSMDDLPARDYGTAVLKQWASERGVRVMDLRELRALGDKFPLAPMPPHHDDVATLCFTSGTTGNPKGAILLHRNFVVTGNAINDHRVELTEEDIMISYLPLAHCFERVLQVAMLSVGGSIGFYRGDVLGLVDDIAALRPTFFPSVPRLFNRIYAKLVDGSIKAPGIKGALFRRAVADKLATIRAGGGVTSAWDYLLFNRVKQILGGRVRLMITGSAPIAADVLTFLRIMFACDILEGFGQTENAAGSTITFPGDHRTGQVGVPVVCNEIKLVDVPEMGYTHLDKQPRGEVWIRGYNVMRGYYKDEEKTRETITSDGWLKTGDIGMITPEGTLSIIDRKKNIFKLAQGEYVAPEKLEALYTKGEWMMQCFVYGESLESVLVGVVVPHPDKLAAWAAQHAPGKPLLEACQSPAFQQLIYNEIVHLAKKHKMMGYEILKRVHVEAEPFSVENGMLTPSFKIKRQQVVDKYKNVLREMYAKLREETVPAKL